MSTQAQPYPRAFTHIGITVTDLQKGIAFYRAAFGLNIIFGPKRLQADESRFGQISRQVYGPDFGEAVVVFLGTANGVVVELFEFVKPRSEPSPATFNYWQTGCFHVCFVDPDVEAAVDRIVSHGGKQRTPVWELWDETGKKIAFCEDPFGNVIEIYSHSTEQMVSNLAAE